MENTNILTTIDNVNSLVDSNFKDTLKCEAKTLFSTGGSYEFIKIMQHIYNEGTIYIKRDFTHCAIKIEDDLYDCEGKLINSNDYVEANDAHIYILDKYLNPYYKLFNISNTIIRLLDKKQYQM